MKFWDSSAVVCLAFVEPATPAMRAILESDPDIAVWWGTLVEFAAAAARKERAGEATITVANEAMARLRIMEDSWMSVPPSPRIRALAERILRTHPLRAADALQLAAALAAAEEQPATLDFVCLDSRLAAAARREGFPVLP